MLKEMFHFKISDTNLIVAGDYRYCQPKPPTKYINVVQNTDRSQNNQLQYKSYKTPKLLC